MKGYNLVMVDSSLTADETNLIEAFKVLDPTN